MQARAHAWPALTSLLVGAVLSCSGSDGEVDTTRAGGMGASSGGVTTTSGGTTTTSGGTASDNAGTTGDGGQNDAGTSTAASGAAAGGSSGKSGGTGGASSGGANAASGGADGGTNEGGTSQATGGSNGGAAGSGGGVVLPGVGGSSPCSDVPIQVRREPATVILLVDQSLSMDQDFDSGTRWEVLREVLVAEGGFVQRYESDVAFGLVLYSMEPEAAGVCPAFTVVPAAIDNWQNIAATLLSAEPLGSTPTGESLALVAAELAAVELLGPRIIVLATDGEPNTCSNPNPDGEVEGRALSLQAVADAYAQRITTLVVSVGEDIGEDLLRELANVGQGFPADDAEERFHRALNPAGLEQAFDELTVNLAGCVLALNGSVDPARAGEGYVGLNGQQLGYGEPDGWRLQGDSAIEFLGAACDALATDANLEIDFPCGVFTPDP